MPWSTTTCPPRFRNRQARSWGVRLTVAAGPAQALLHAADELGFVDSLLHQVDGKRDSGHVVGDVLADHLVQRDGLGLAGCIGRRSLGARGPRSPCRGRRLTRCACSLARRDLSAVRAFGLKLHMLARERFLSMVGVLMHDEVVVLRRSRNVFGHVHVQVEREAGRIRLLGRVKHHGLAVQAVAERPGLAQHLRGAQNGGEHLQDHLPIPLARRGMHDQEIEEAQAVRLVPIHWALAWERRLAQGAVLVKKQDVALLVDVREEGRLLPFCRQRAIVVAGERIPLVEPVCLEVRLRGVGPHDLQQTLLESLLAFFLAFRRNGCIRFCHRQSPLQSKLSQPSELCNTTVGPASAAVCCKSVAASFTGATRDACGRPPLPSAPSCGPSHAS